MLQDASEQKTQQISSSSLSLYVLCALKLVSGGTKLSTLLYVSAAYFPAFLVQLIRDYYYINFATSSLSEGMRSKEKVQRLEGVSTLFRRNIRRCIKCTEGHWGLFMVIRPDMESRSTR